MNVFRILAGYKKKNGRTMFWCTCASCGIQKTRFVKKSGKLAGPSAGAGVVDTVAGTALDMFVDHSLPWIGKKALEIRQCYGSEALRNPKLQKNATYCTLDRLNPMIHNVGAQAMNQLSTKLRPTTKYKTNRKDLDQLIGKN